MSRRNMVKRNLIHPALSDFFLPATNGIGSFRFSRFWEGLYHGGMIPVIVSFRVYNRDGMRARIDSEWSEVWARLRWKCIRCGKCCKMNWSVDLTWHEFRRTIDRNPSRKHPVFDREVDPSTGLDHPFFLIEGKCPYLIDKEMVCSLYPEWFYTCATYPFLLTPEKVLLYHRECSGLGHGPEIDMDSIKEKIIAERKRAGMAI
jgi:Fe-S-cluster containining protein